MQIGELMSRQVDCSSLINSPYGHCMWGSHCTTYSRLICSLLWTIPWRFCREQAAPQSFNTQLNQLQDKLIDFIYASRFVRTKEFNRKVSLLNQGFQYNFKPRFWTHPFVPCVHILHWHQQWFSVLHNPAFIFSSFVYLFTGITPKVSHKAIQLSNLKQTNVH